VATELPTLTVRVELPPAATVVGLSDAVGPAGLTLAARLTLPALPTCVVDIVLVPLLPCAMLKLAGEAPMLKSAGGGAVIVTVTLVECVAPELSVPVTVTV
jgi:hypothetical protein